MTRIPVKKILIATAIATLVAVIISSDQLAFVNLDWLKTNQQGLADAIAADPVTSQLLFFALYVAMTALSIPGAAFMTVASGALFGVVQGTALALTAASLGATLAFLFSRYLLKDFISKLLGDRLNAINAGVEKDGAYYLITLRLVPLFPFFLINVAMALTPIRVWTFFWVSFVGMFAGTALYVNAGTQLAKLNALSDILSIPLLLSLALLGVLPLLTKKLVSLVNRYRPSH